MKKTLLTLGILLLIIIASTLYIRHWKSVNDLDQALTDSLSMIDIPLPPPPARLYGFIEDSFHIERDLVGRNQNLASILLAHNVDYPVIHQLAQNSREVFDVRKIRTGNKYAIFASKDTVSVPAYFVYEIDNTDYIIMSLTDSLKVTRHQKPIEIIRKLGSGVITSSLWNTINENNLSPMLAINLSEIYAWTVDFFGIEKGDNFRVIYDEAYVEGVSIGEITIQAALFNHHGQPCYAFRFKEDSTWSYFDAEGLSLRKAFLKAPLKFSRISSRFSHSRLHPVLKIRRPHHGVDYAAPMGTPVYALGDGRITHRGWDPKGGGNYIKIKHNSVYTTVYMHLSGFAKGITKGQTVSQGQLIGYVGKTGLATGPHLDFRVYKNGSPIDPLKIEAPSVDPVREENIPRYLEFIESYKSDLDKIKPASEQTTTQAQADSVSH